MAIKGLYMCVTWDEIEERFSEQQVFPRDLGSGNRLPGSVIDY